jgi:transcriptional activator HAC1
MEALRLVSEGCEDRVQGRPGGSRETRDGRRTPHEWLYGTPLPSKEVILTLLWALRVEERTTARRELLECSGSPAVPTLGSSINTPTNKYNLRVISTKRKPEFPTGHSGKRFRLG